MERLTGKNAKSLYEVYSEVYAQPEVEQLDENKRGAAARANRERAEEQERIARVQAQNQVRQRLASGGSIGVRGATSSVQQGTGYATRLGGKEGIIVKGDAGALGVRQPINVAGRTLYPAKRGNDIIYLPSDDAPKANSLTNRPPQPPQQRTNIPPQLGAPDKAGSRKRYGNTTYEVQNGKWVPLTASQVTGGNAPVRPAGGNAPVRPAGGVVADKTSSAPAPAPSFKVGDQQMTKAQINAKYAELRKTDPAAAKAFGDKAFAATNPKLDAAAKERARTRGTSATTNPQMADMKSRLPAPRPATPAPAATSFNPNAPRVVPTTSRPSAGGAAAVARPAVAARPVPVSAVRPTNTTKSVPPTDPNKKKQLQQSADLFDIVKGELLDEGYSEEDAMYIMANLNEEQREIVMNEGIGALLKLGAKALKSGAGKKVLSKAANLVKGGKKGKSAISKRATKVVKDQRAGVSGTADELNLMQKDVEAVSSKLKKLKDPTRGDAVAAAGRVERDVRKANAMTPARTSSKPFGQRIDKSVSDQGKIGFEVPKKSSIGRPLSYKEMMAQRRNEWAGKSEAEKKEIFNQYIKRWEGRNK